MNEHHGEQREHGEHQVAGDGKSSDNVEDGGRRGSKVRETGEVEGKLGVEFLVEIGEKGHTGQVAGEIFEVVYMTGEVVEKAGELGEAVEMTVDYLRSQKPCS